MPGIHTFLLLSFLLDERTGKCEREREKKKVWKMCNSVCSLWRVRFWELDTFQYIRFFGWKRKKMEKEERRVWMSDFCKFTFSLKQLPIYLPNTHCTLSTDLQRLYLIWSLTASLSLSLFPIWSTTIGYLLPFWTIDSNTLRQSSRGKYLLAHYSGSSTCVLLKWKAYLIHVYA